MPAPPALPRRASRALGVRDVRSLALELPALDVADPHLVAVDASGRGDGPVGAFAVVDGAGRAHCHTFLLGPDVENASGRSYLIEAMASQTALRPFANISAVTLISDSQEVATLIRTARRPRGRRPRTSIERDAPQIARAILGHCRRLDVRVRRDISKGSRVAESPHMIAAHRLALGALRLRVDGHDAVEDDEAREWLTAFAQLPGRRTKSIQWRAGYFHRQQEKKASVGDVLRPLP